MFQPETAIGVHCDSFVLSLCFDRLARLKHLKAKPIKRLNYCKVPKWKCSAPLQDSSRITQVDAAAYPMQKVTMKFDSVIIHAKAHTLMLPEIAVFGMALARSVRGLDR